MSNHLIKKLFSCIENPAAEDMWLDILQDYQSSNGDVVSIRNPDNQWTLLHYAAENIFPRVAKWLIGQGAEIDARDSEGNTSFLIGLDAAIDCAVQENRDEVDFSVVTILLKEGADESVVSNDGISKDSLLKIYGSSVANQYQSKVKVQL
jgi:hypothetical protein